MNMVAVENEQGLRQLVTCCFDCPNRDTGYEEWYDGEEETCHSYPSCSIDPEVDYIRFFLPTHAGKIHDACPLLQENSNAHS